MRAWVRSDGRALCLTHAPMQVEVIPLTRWDRFLWRVLRRGVVADAILAQNNPALAEGEGEEEWQYTTERVDPLDVLTSKRKLLAEGWTPPGQSWE